jgi:uncharacterized membrane protein (UPF0127 family)
VNRSAVLATLGLALGLALAGCRPAPAPATPGAPAAARPPARARVTIDSPSGRSTTVEAEVVRTPEEMARGLMYRERLAPDAGMLFLFPEEANHVFWMKNTLIPLDMIFIDAGGAVVGVVERAEPLTTSARQVGQPSRSVLEVAGGTAAERGVRRGDRVRIEEYR